LYQYELATYDTGDSFDSDAALGFISLWGLPLRTQASIQMLPESDTAPMLPHAPNEDS
jgi:argininosuccinate synthase